MYLFAQNSKVFGLSNASVATLLRLPCPRVAGTEIIGKFARSSCCHAERIELRRLNCGVAVLKGGVGLEWHRDEREGKHGVVVQIRFIVIHVNRKSPRKRCYLKGIWLPYLMLDC